MGDNIKGTATYVRISEDRLGLELGVERQRADCAELAERRGWAPVTEHRDNDISAASGRFRPGYEALMAAVERGEVARVVVWHPSRLWRNRRERADGIDLMKAHRVTLACVKGPELDMATAYGRGLAGLVGEFDTLESDVKSERVKAATAQRARDGRPHGGSRLWGYALDGVTVVPEEAAQVATWYEQLLAGRSVAGIARDAGVTPHTLRGRLLNARYAGIRVYEGAEHRGRWDAVVPVDVWRAAVSLLSDPSRTTNGGLTARKHLGSGLYVCARCETRHVYSAYYSSRGVARHVYRCRPELGGCSRSWHRERVDAFVVEAVRERLGRGDLAALLPADRPDLDRLRQEAAGIRTRLATLPTDYVLLGLDRGRVAQAVRAGQARLAAIEAATGDVRGGVLGALVACDDPVALWDAIPADQADRRQAVVRAVLSITLTGAPRGRPPGDWRTSVAWYGAACVVLGPPAG